MKVILLVGLPGSGKSYLAKNLAQETDVIIDDIKSLSELNQYLKTNLTVYISDPFLCLEKSQKGAAEFFENESVEISWIFFENNLQQCLKNVKSRKDGRAVENFARYLNTRYSIPVGEVTRPVYNPDNS